MSTEQGELALVDVCRIFDGRPALTDVGFSVTVRAWSRPCAPGSSAAPVVTIIAGIAIVEGARAFAHRFRGFVDVDDVRVFKLFVRRIVAGLIVTLVA